MRFGAAVVIVSALAGCAAQAPKSAPPPAPAAMATPVDRSKIMAVLLPAAAVDPVHAVAEPLGGGLDFVCYLGRPGEGRVLTDTDLPGLGVDRAGAITLARSNLTAGLRPITTVAHPVPPGEVGTIDGDYAESGRVLLHDDWTPIAEAMGGKLFVSAPAADTVLYTRAGVPGALGTIATMAQAAMAKSPRPISDAVFRWTPKGWDVVARSSAGALPPGS